MAHGAIYSHHKAKAVEHALAGLGRHDHVAVQAEGTQGLVIRRRLVVVDDAILQHKPSAAPVLWCEAGST
jgi:hypothetical protein